MKRSMLALFAVLSLLLVVANPATAAPGGNSAAAARCENGGYLTVTRSDKSGFKNEGQCTKYAAQGGVFTVVSPTAVLDFVRIPAGENQVLCQARLTVTGYEPGTYTAQIDKGREYTLTVDAFGNGAVSELYIFYFEISTIAAYINGESVDTEPVDC